MLVPEISENVISVSQLTDKGFDVKFIGNKSKITKEKILYIDAQKDEKLHTYME